MLLEETVTWTVVINFVAVDMSRMPQINHVVCRSLLLRTDQRQRQRR